MPAKRKPGRPKGSKTKKATRNVASPKPKPKKEVKIRQPEICSGCGAKDSYRVKHTRKNRVLGYTVQYQYCIKCDNRRELRTPQ